MRCAQCDRPPIRPRRQGAVVATAGNFGSGVLSLILLALLSTHGLAAQWGGELRFCIRSEPRSFHPALADSDAAETIRYLTGGVLVRVNRSNQQLEPELATSWKIENGGKSIVFQLRQGSPFPMARRLPRTTWSIPCRSCWTRPCIPRPETPSRREAAP